jgi:hypothetical protein
MNIFAVAAFVASATANDPHAGHDHSLLKPQGPFYGLLSYETKDRSKTWNNLEISIFFKENTFNMKWWFGMRVNGWDIKKQVFACIDVPFKFDEENLHVAVDVVGNTCLSDINKKFPPGSGLGETLKLSVDHNSGDLSFKVARNVIQVTLYAVDAEPAIIPSGEGELAPLNPPGRRAESYDAPAHAQKKEATVPVANSASVLNKANDETLQGIPSNFNADETVSTTSERSAGSKMGSFVTAAAIIIAGLIL